MLITPEFLLTAGFSKSKAGPFDVYRTVGKDGNGIELEESHGKTGWAFRPMCGGSLVGGWPRLLTQQAEVMAIAGLLEIVLK